MDSEVRNMCDGLIKNIMEQEWGKERPKTKLVQINGNNEP